MTYPGKQLGARASFIKRLRYNPDNTLKQVVNRASSATIISQHDYLYDGFGNRRQGIDKIGTVTQTNTYTYDSLDRLLTAKNGTVTLDEAFQYSPLHNLTQQTIGTPVTATNAYVYDAANQLLESRVGTPTGTLLSANVFDANGSLTKTCVGGTVTRTATACTGTTTTTLTLDSLNRTTQVAKTGVATETYAYDSNGRRIRKVSGTVTSNYLYQGEDIYAEYGTAYTAPTAVYTHGPATDDPLIRLTGTIGPNATPQYYHQDGLGSVVAMSNATGGTDATTRYDAWGNKVTSTGTTPQYGYTGREPDATGLVYYRARYYDPGQRRFTQRDPIGFGGGINQYAYVGNNPINWTDPEGLCPSCIGAVSSVVMGGAIRWISGGDVIDRQAILTDAFLGAAGVGLASKISTLSQGLRAGTGISRSRYLGQIGEDAAGIVGPKTAVRAPSGNVIIPDGINQTKKVITEVKNVSAIRSRDATQIRDIATYAEQEGFSAVVQARRSTDVSRIQGLFDSGNVALKYIPNIADDGFRMLSPLEAGAIGAGFGQGTQSLYNFATGNSRSPYSGSALTGFNPRAKK